MNNNDMLIRLRYALDIKNTDMIKAFELGGIKITKEDYDKIMTKVKETEEEEEAEEDYMKCTFKMLESFLNGFIILKRGKQELKPGEKEQPVKYTMCLTNANNLFLKKVKIALNLSSDDVQSILGLAGVVVSNSELSAFFRKEGHKNYMQCKDHFTRNFLKGLALKYRTN